MRKRRKEGLTLLAEGWPLRAVASALDCSHVAVLKWKRSAERGDTDIRWDRHGTGGRRWADHDCRRDRASRVARKDPRHPIRMALKRCPGWLTREAVSKACLRMSTGTLPRAVEGVVVRRWTIASMPVAFGIHRHMPLPSEHEEDDFFAPWSSIPAMLTYQLNNLEFRRGPDDTWIAPPEDVALRALKRHRMWPLPEL